MCPCFLEWQRKFGYTLSPIRHRKNPTANLRSLATTIPLVFRYNHLYYEPNTNAEILFSSAELAQIHRNLGYAPPSFVYSALRRAYPVETGASNLQELQELTKLCKAC